MAKSHYNFSKEELELLRLIMKQLHLTQRELTNMKRKVKGMIESSAPKKKKRRS